MGKGLSSSKKTCGRCGKSILEGQAYTAVAENFEAGETVYDLLTKSYRWSTYHNTSSPSRIKVVCEEELKNK